MDTKQTQKNEQSGEAKRHTVLIGPGTAGLVQRIPSKDEEDRKQLKVLKPKEWMTCGTPEY